MTTTFAAYRAINEYVTFEGKTYLGTSLGNGHFSVAVKTIKGTYRRIASNRIIDAVTALVKAQVEVKAQQRAFLERTEATIAQNTTPLAKVLEQIPTLPAAPAAERAKEHFAAMKAEIERVRAKAMPLDTAKAIVANPAGIKDECVALARDTVAAAELAELDLLTPEENAQVDAYRARVAAEQIIQDVAVETNVAAYGVALRIDGDCYAIEGETGRHTLDFGSTDRARLLAHVQGFIARQPKAL